MFSKKHLHTISFFAFTISLMIGCSGPDTPNVRYALNAHEIIFQHLRGTDLESCTEISEVISRHRAVGLQLSAINSANVDQYIVVATHSLSERALALADAIETVSKAPTSETSVLHGFITGFASNNPTKGALATFGDTERQMAAESNLAIKFEDFQNAKLFFYKQIGEDKEVASAASRGRFDID